MYFYYITGESGDRGDRGQTVRGPKGMQGPPGLPGQHQSSAIAPWTTTITVHFFFFTCIPTHSCSYPVS